MNTLNSSNAFSNVVKHVTTAGKQSPPATSPVRPKQGAHLGTRTAVRAAYFLLALLFLLLPNGLIFGQTDVEQIDPILKEEILAPNVALYQVKKYLLSRVAAPPVATTPAEWTAEAQRLRQHLLKDVVFHGWPEEVVNSAPKFEDLGVIETGQGYRLRKLRYEIVPGFQSVAILY